jgi:hypothetical protein
VRNIALIKNVEKIGKNNEGLKKKPEFRNIYSTTSSSM